MLVTATLTVHAWRADRDARAAASNSGEEDTSPWFTEDDLWPDSRTPRALSQPYTELSSEMRIKAERALASEEEPLGS